jgi:hypothetical protein
VADNLKLRSGAHPIRDLAAFKISQNHQPTSPTWLRLRPAVKDIETGWLAEKWSWFDQQVRQVDGMWWLCSVIDLGGEKALIEGSSGRT